MIEVLNECVLGESHGQCVHSMMAMVITFCPILYPAYATSIVVGMILHISHSLVLAPVQFLQDIHQFPILTQLVGNGTSSCNNSSADLVQHGQSLLGYVLGITQVTLNEAIGDFSFRHLEFPQLGTLIGKNALASIEVAL